MDYVFRSLGYDYLGMNDFVHVKAVDEITPNGNDNKDTQDYAEPVEPIQNTLNVTETTADIKSENDYETVEVASTSINKQFTNGGNGKSMKAQQAHAAKQIGYTGEQCISCGSIRVKRNGSCTVCEDCGTTTGCS